MKKTIETAGVILLIIVLLCIPSNSNVIAGNYNGTNQSDAPNTKEDQGTLSGYVTDTEMNPIQEARIRVPFHDTYQENYSDSTGYYHVTDIPLCNCTKNSTCSKQGYDTVWIDLPILENSTYDFVLVQKGHWLYVGGDGPGNYSTIQAAIDNASTGDTIYVYQGTYHEAVTIDVWSLTLFGENRDGTIIETNASEDTMVIKKSDVSIHGFTIIGEDSGINVEGELSTIVISDNNISQCYRGVEFEYDSDDSWIIIENNIFYSNHGGIYFAGDSWMNTIRNNLFLNNFDGMEVSGTSLFIENNTFVNSGGSGLSIYGQQSIIERNVFQGNGEGLSGGGIEHTITGNLFLGNRIGLNLGGSKHHITGNLFKNSSVGVKITGFNTTVGKNNFIKNEKHAWFAEENKTHGNTWDNNYWSNTFRFFGRTLIFGKIHTHIKKFLQLNPYETTYFWMPWINVDTEPAKEPFPVG